MSSQRRFIPITGAIVLAFLVSGFYLNFPFSQLSTSSLVTEARTAAHGSEFAVAHTIEDEVQQALAWTYIPARDADNRALSKLSLIHI